ncbi:MAG: hypothetical protein IJP17_04620 [Clostridia bacterium]|nr:hypothetical protein [Clostridia bacterium]
MSNLKEINRLRSMLTAPDGCIECGCTLSDEELSGLLERYSDINTAAYHACVRLSQENDVHMPDGTVMPTQSEYWLRMALTFRKNLGGTMRRADEVM